MHATALNKQSLLHWTAHALPGKARFHNQRLHQAAGFAKLSVVAHSQHPKSLRRPARIVAQQAGACMSPSPGPGQGPQPYFPSAASLGPDDRPVRRAAGAARPEPCMLPATLHVARISACGRWQHGMPVPAPESAPLAHQTALREAAASRPFSPEPVCCRRPSVALSTVAGVR